MVWLVYLNNFYNQMLADYGNPFSQEGVMKNCIKTQSRSVKLITNSHLKLFLK